VGLNKLVLHQQTKFINFALDDEAVFLPIRTPSVHKIIGEARAKSGFL